MIDIGEDSVIGAGLFVGSGHAIAEAGPAALIAYVFTGMLVVLVMRMLGEMATAQPDMRLHCCAGPTRRARRARPCWPRPRSASSR